MSFDARAVANYLLDKAAEEGVALDHMSLQKLVYISHGWHLATLGRPLFDNQIEAWPYGPVVPDVYHEFKHAGHGKISDRAFTYQPYLDEVQIFSLGDSDATVDEIRESKEVLDRVWNAYKGYSGPQLSDLTHRAGSPWHTVAGGKKREEFRKLRIADDLIAEYYTQLAGRNRQYA